jgi:hypothetical protein
MALTVPSWMQWTLRIVAWAVWQLCWILFAFILTANLFSEYGVYSNRSVADIAFVVFLVFALWIGTWKPLREWRDARDSDEGEAKPS